MEGEVGLTVMIIIEAEGGWQEALNSRPTVFASTLRGVEGAGSGFSFNMSIDTLLVWPVNARLKSGPPSSEHFNRCEMTKGSSSTNMNIRPRKKQQVEWCQVLTVLQVLIISLLYWAINQGDEDVRMLEQFNTTGRWRPKREETLLGWGRRLEEGLEQNERKVEYECSIG